MKEDLSDVDGCSVIHEFIGQGSPVGNSGSPTVHEASVGCTIITEFINQGSAVPPGSGASARNPVSAKPANDSARHAEQWIKVAAVQSRNDLANFVDCLRAELLTDPESWENATLSDYLE